jgi:hypothetical protein
MTSTTTHFDANRFWGIGALFGAAARPPVLLVS